MSRPISRDEPRTTSTTTEWGVKWPDDPDVEVRSDEQDARRVVAMYADSGAEVVSQRVVEIRGPWSGEDTTEMIERLPRALSEEYSAAAAAAGAAVRADVGAAAEVGADAADDSLAVDGGRDVHQDIAVDAGLSA